MRFLYLATLLSCAVSTAEAQTFLQTKPAVTGEFSRLAPNSTAHPWPGRSAYKFKVTPWTGSWDGMPVAYQRLRLGPLDLQVSVGSLSSWPISASGSYSLNLDYHWSDQAHAWLAWFPTGVFLDRLDNASWQSYLGTIPHNSGGKASLVINDDSEQNTSMLRILGQRTRVLVYDVSDPKTGQKQSTHVLIFTEYPEGLLVFGLEGVSEKVYQASAQFGDFVQEFSTYSP